MFCFSIFFFIPQLGWIQLFPKLVSSALKQREESVFLRARTCRHREWGFVIHSEREVKPSGSSGAEPFGGIQKNLHICWKHSWAHTAPTPVPPHMSHFALLWVSNMYFLLIQKNLVFLTSFSIHALKLRCAFFLGEIDKPSQGILQRAKRKTVNVGICLEGVYVMDVKEKVRCFSLCVGIAL